MAGDCRGSDAFLSFMLISSIGNRERKVDGARINRTILAICIVFAITQNHNNSSLICRFRVPLLFEEVNMENKPNQHYVWQKYLEPWKKNGKLVCLRNKKDILRSNSRNVASQRYFYNINNLTLNDCNLIRRLFINNQPEPMKKLLEGWVNPIEQLLQIYDLVSKNRKVDDSIKALKELTLKNLLEELHMEIETEGIEGLLKLQAGDISFLFESDKEDMTEDVEFILYLSFQYFRTKKIKQSVEEALREYASHFTSFDNTFNLLVPIFSTLFGYNVFERIKRKELYCNLLENASDISFITGDQPVVNIDANFDANQETTDLSLYYPLSPTVSLLITRSQIDDVKCSSEKVKEYNDMIARQALELIFANDASDLTPYVYREDA